MSSQARDSAARPSTPYYYGVPLETAIARRERVAAMYDIEYGKERVFPELLDALLAEVPEGVDVLEVGAATGYLTRPLLERAGRLTALEPSAGMLRVLVSSQVAESATLSTRQGMVEDLGPDDIYDVAVVTFTPRRGPGLLRLLMELATRVRDRVVMLLDEEGTLDWAYLARAVSKHGLGVRLQIVCGQSSDPATGPQRAVVFVVEVARVCPISGPAAGRDDLAAWSVDARRIKVAHPPPRGTATRLVRYVLARGDQAVAVEVDARSVERLHGNLRTAVHRIARDRLTVRRDGDLIQIMRLPRSHEAPDA